MSAKPAEINASMTPAEWAMLIGLSVIFGGSFFFNGVIVRELPVLTIVFSRVALAAIALHLFVRLSGRSMPWTREAWLAFFGMGTLNNVIPFSLIVFGQTHIASGAASILNATTPLFTLLVANALTSDEKLTRLKLAGVITGFTGVAVMIGGGAIADGWMIAGAQIACLCAALSYAFAGVFGRRFKRLGIAPIAVATGQVTASAILMLPIMVIVDHPWTLPVPSLQVLLSLLGLAIVCTAFAYILFFRILSGAGATNLSLVTFLVPVSAILLGIFILGETLLPRHVAGMVLIACGLLLVDGRAFRRRLRRNPAG